MKTELEKLVDNLTRHTINVYNLMKAFQDASVSNYQTVKATITNEDGTTEEVVVNSFQSLQSEISRIANNFSSLTNTNNISYIVNADGTLSQYSKTTFMNAEYIQNMVLSDTCVVDKISNIADFLFPMVKIPVTIDAKINSDIICKTFEISDGWENIPDNITFLALQNLINNGDIVVERELTRHLNIEKEQVRYFGKFTIESITNLPNNVYQFTLNDLKYTGLNVNGNNVNLAVNDILVSNTGSSKYQIQSISTANKTINVTRIAGTEMVSVGVDKLLFNQNISNDTRIVGIPVRPAQKIVAFLSTEHINAISYPSNGLKIDTENYEVDYNGDTYTIDEFFSNYVTNISDYLLSIVDENNIPLSLGITPEKPQLLSGNFQVVQINKHLTESKTISDINKWNDAKQKTSNDIEYKNKEIETLKTSLSNVNTIKEKQTILNKISTLQSDINSLNANLLTISRNIDDSAISNNLKNLSAKYKILGFWHVQNNITSPLTGRQQIIKYDVQYRYLSASNDKIESTIFKMNDDGKEVSVTFSPWSTCDTSMLHKVKNVDGNVTWESPDINSSEDTNINQCMISISENESVEIRVRAISEAGYPLSPLKSEWSDIIKVDFPEDLKSAKITSVITQNETDLMNANFVKILTDAGYSSHIANQIIDAEKIYHHPADKIASGQYTNEMKIIPLDVCIKNIISDIANLKNSSSNNVSVELIDFNNESYSIVNGSTLELFAGNYSEEIDIHRKTNFGSIIRKKSYLKIKNKNNIPVEIRTLKPQNSLTPISSDEFYFNVPIANHKDNNNVQTMKQILYFRNTDLSLQHTQNQSFDLYKANESDITTNISEVGRFDQNVAETEKNAFVYDGNNIIKGKYMQDGSSLNQNFAIFSSENPVLLTDNEVLKLQEFKRISKMTKILKDIQYQNQLTNGNYDLLKLGFDDNDVYAIGLNTCGAFLYPSFPNVDNLKVKGDNSDSSLVLESNQEILIPIIYEYRMMDRFGNVNGDTDFNYDNELIYSKRLGIDMIINNVKFQFDIKVSSRFKSKISSLSASNISTIMS